MKSSFLTAKVWLFVVAYFLVVVGAQAGPRPILVKASLLYDMPGFNRHSESLEASLAAWEEGVRTSLEANYEIDFISAAEPVCHPHGGPQCLYMRGVPFAHEKRFTASRKATADASHPKRLEGSFGSTTYLVCPDGFRVGPDKGGVYPDAINTDFDCIGMEESYEAPPPACRAEKLGNPIDAISGRKEESISLLREPIDIRMLYDSVHGWRPSFSTYLTHRGSGQTLMKEVDCHRGIVGGTQKCVPRLSYAEFNPSSAPALDVELMTPDGVLTEFTQEGISATPGVAATLSMSSAGSVRYIVRSPAGAKFFDREGRLLRDVSADGEGVMHTYMDASGRKIHDESPSCLNVSRGSAMPGQPACLTALRRDYQVGFEYGEHGLVKIIGPAGEIYQLDYNGVTSIIKSAPRNFGLVTSILYPDTRMMTFSYNQDGHTEGADLPHALTSKTDIAGNVIANFYYDASGRAVVTELAGGVGRFEVRARANTGDFEVTNPNGELSTLSKVPFYYQPAPGFYTWVSAVSERSQPAGAGCAAAIGGSVYSVNGDLLGVRDMNGVQTCLEVDEATRKIKRRFFGGVDLYSSCESVFLNPPAGLLRETTSWHADWHLKTKEAQPNKITTYVYHGQPDPFIGGAVASCAPDTAKHLDGKPLALLCKRVEQATVDSTGENEFGAALQPGIATRTWQWTYDSMGRVLTHSDPRKNVVVKNEYHSTNSSEFRKGDLKNATNAAGHATRYLRYSPHGQPAETVDANGISSTHVYDARQRLKAMTRNGAVTSYEYWPTGLLKQVTQPDASYVAYEYDGAHRLIAVSDNDGNRITYTLDNSGNRKAEEVKDPTGALKRMVSRHYDALGREQQTTGRE